LSPPVWHWLDHQRPPRLFIAMIDSMAIAIHLQQAVTGKRTHTNCGGDYCRARL
jgi:hypothetical protein